MQTIKNKQDIQQSECSRHNAMVKSRLSATIPLSFFKKLPTLEKKCPLDNFWHIYFSGPLFSREGVIRREYAVNDRRKHFEDSGKIIAVIRDFLHVGSGH